MIKTDQGTKPTSKAAERSPGPQADLSALALTPSTLRDPPPVERTPCSKETFIARWASRVYPDTGASISVTVKNVARVA
jgi:hypothetical protein